MKNLGNYHDRKIGSVISVFVVMVYSLISGCSNSTLDDNRENVTIEEAQSLVSFKICYPTYYPSGIDSNPTISYYADYGDSPEKDIVLKFKRKDSNETVFDVWQRYDPDANNLDKDLPDEVHHAWKYQLVHWIIPDDSRKADSVLENTKMEFTVSQTNLIVWWLYEIIDPIQYRATLTRWNDKHIRFRIYSYLPTEEIKQVTISMFSCSNP